jgi:hypothetical protein
MVRDTRRTLDTRRIRRLREPAKFEVEADIDGAPRRISLGGVWQDVAPARRPWRIDQHWWRDDHVQREYFRVAPLDGPPLTIYQDLLTRTWFRQDY